MTAIRTVLLSLLSVSVLAACSEAPSPEAAQFCLDHAGVIQKEGEHTGLCKFRDGSVCAPDLYMRAQCSPGDNP